jgi:uncharacterized membrane protein
MINWIITHSPLLYLTQSIWRDEAFSILVAEKPLIEVLPKLSFEPPVYYTLLHFWMKIFGNSELSTRLLSFVGVLGATIILIYWGEKIFKKHFLSWFLPIFFLINPMIIYYAFEVRTYGWYIFFSVLSMYSLYNKKWNLYILANVLGFYTHAYFIFLIFAQAIYLGWFEWKSVITKPKNLWNLSSFRSMCITGILALPWVLRIVSELPRLKQSWYFPVDFHLIQSVLGNMFVGYEGTPWFLWPYTQMISILLLLIFIFTFISKRFDTLTKQMLFVVFIPLFTVIGMSFIKPLFVNRYLIPVTVSEVILIVLAIGSLQSKKLQYMSAASVMILVCAFNLWYPLQHQKLPIRDTFQQIQAIKNPDDLIYASSSLILFESIYYSPDRSKVFFYNPSGQAFPWFVGDAAFSPSIETRTLPEYPKKAFIINEDGTWTVKSHALLRTK